MLKEEGREGEEEENEGGGGRRKRKPQQQLIIVSLTCTMQGKIGLGNTINNRHMERDCKARFWR